MKPDTVGELKPDFCDGLASRIIPSSMRGTVSGRPRQQIHPIKGETCESEIMLWVETDPIEKIETTR